MHHKMIILNPRYQNDKAKSKDPPITASTDLDDHKLGYQLSSFGSVAISSQSIDIRHSSKVLLLLGRVF